MTTQFDRIFHGLGTDPGKFRVAASGMAWKSEVDGAAVISIPSAEIQWCQWSRVARNFQLRVGLDERKGGEDRIKSRTKRTFDGFAREDHDKLAGLLKSHFGVTLETKEVSFKGWNWGVTDFQGQDLAFMISNRVAFELPLSNVANSNIAGRTEVSIEFSGPPSANTAKKTHVADEMVEIRFHVPGTHVQVRGSDAGSDVDANDDDEEVSAAQVFHDTVKDKANIGQVIGALILSFEEVNVLTPRGRYDVDMFPDFLRLHGKTYDYKILYSSISRLFLLPKDDQHVLFILGLSTPIRQGQTRYQYLVMQFTREEEITAELNLTEEEVATYDRLKKNYEDPTFEVVSGVFRALAKKKIIGAGSFQSNLGHPGIKANLKAVQGDLFMLEKYIFFVSKQPTLIELADIHQVVFSRVGASMGATAARTFDIKIITKSGPEYTFTSVSKEEYETTETYLQDKKIKIRNEMVPDADRMLAAVGVDDDDDMQSLPSSGDEAPRVKVQRGSDDDSETDDDFQASESDAGSPSESDGSEEGAATASDASGDEDFMKKPKKGKKKGGEDAGDAPKKKLTKKKPAKTSASDAEGDGADKPKVVKKKKKVAKDGDEAAMDVDEPVKAKAKPKPRPTKAKATEEDGDEDAMAVDPKPKPKPKPKKVQKPTAQAQGEEEPKDSPPRKKLKITPK